MPGARTRCQLTPLIATIVVAIAAVACGSKPTDRDDGAAVRIVSLSPALTRMLVDLGVGADVVGRSRYCTAVSGEIPVVGDLRVVDYERLIAIAPTHVLVQAPTGGVDAKLTSLADERGWTLAAWTSIDTIDDVESVLMALPETLHPPGPKRDALAATAADLVNELASVLSPTGVDTASVPPVLLVYQTEPVGIFGAGTFLHEILVRLGGRNAAATIDGWAELSLEDVARLNPPAIVLVRSGEAPTPLAVAGPLGRLDIDAVRHGRLAVLDDPEAMLPSSGLIGVAEALRVILTDFAREEP